MILSQFLCRLVYIKCLLYTVGAQNFYLLLLFSFIYKVIYEQRLLTFITATPGSSFLVSIFSINAGSPSTSTIIITTGIASVLTRLQGE